MIEDVLADIAYAAGNRGFDLDDSHERREQLIRWAHAFVAQHQRQHTDWEQVDFFLALDEFIDQQMSGFTAKPVTTVFLLAAEDTLNPAPAPTRAFTSLINAQAAAFIDAATRRPSPIELHFQYAGTITIAEIPDRSLRYRIQAQQVEF